MTLRDMSVSSFLDEVSLLENVDLRFIFKVSNSVGVLFVLSLFNNREQNSSKAFIIYI